MRFDIGKRQSKQFDFGVNRCFCLSLSSPFLIKLKILSAFAPKRSSLSSRSTFGQGCGYCSNAFCSAFSDQLDQSTDLLLFHIEFYPFPKLSSVNFISSSINQSPPTLKAIPFAYFCICFLLLLNLRLTVGNKLFPVEGKLCRYSDVLPLISVYDLQLIHNHSSHVDF